MPCLDPDVLEELGSTEHLKQEIAKLKKENQTLKQELAKTKSDECLKPTQNPLAPLTEKQIKELMESEEILKKLAEIEKQFKPQPISWPNSGPIWIVNPSYVTDKIKIDYIDTTWSNIQTNWDYIPVYSTL